MIGPLGRQEAGCYSQAAMSSMTQRRCRLVGGIRAEIQTCKNYFAPLCTYTITLHTVNMIYLRMAPCEKYLSCYQVMAYFHYATLTPLAIWGMIFMTHHLRFRGEWRICVKNAYRCSCNQNLKSTTITKVRSKQGKII